MLFVNGKTPSNCGKIPIGSVLMRISVPLLPYWCRRDLSTCYDTFPMSMRDADKCVQRHGRKHRRLSSSREHPGRLAMRWTIDSRPDSWARSSKRNEIMRHRYCSHYHHRRKVSEHWLCIWRVLYLCYSPECGNESGRPERCVFLAPTFRSLGLGHYFSPVRSIVLLESLHKSLWVIVLDAIDGSCPSLHKVSLTCMLGINPHFRRSSPQHGSQEW